MEHRAVRGESHEEAVGGGSGVAQCQEEVMLLMPVADPATSSLVFGVGSVNQVKCLPQRQRLLSFLLPSSSSSCFPLFPLLSSWLLFSFCSLSPFLVPLLLPSPLLHPFTPLLSLPPSPPPFLFLPYTFLPLRICFLLSLLSPLSPLSPLVLFFLTQSQSLPSPPFQCHCTAQAGLSRTHDSPAFLL